MRTFTAVHCQKVTKTEWKKLKEKLITGSFNAKKEEKLFLCVLKLKLMEF